MILQANALHIPLADQSVNCCVTSPPYWGLRSYVADGDPMKEHELGLEPTPAEYVENMVAVFREVKRVLRDDGTLWLNLGSSYATVASSSRKVYTLRDDLTPREIAYVCMEMFGVRLDGYEASSEGPVPQVLSRRLHHGANGSRSSLSGEGIEGELSAEQAGGYSQGQGKAPGLASGSDIASGREVRVLRGSDIRVYDDRARQQRRRGAQAQDHRTPAALGSENIERHSEPGLSEGHLPSALLQLQLRERLMGVLSTSRLKAEVIPPHVFRFFRSVGHKEKDLVNIPVLVAEALREDGWYLRSDIIWSKPNPMPESVTSRPTKAHEYLFLLAKQPRYFYDAEAVKEESVGVTGGGFSQKYAEQQPAHGAMALERPAETGYRNRRTVWTIATHSFEGAHFATYPPALVEPCILAGTSAAGCCSVCGAPWGRVTEREFMGDGNPYSYEDRAIAGNKMTLSGKQLAAFKAAHPDKPMGWRPTCGHDAPTVPAIVLDPFCGSGTTGAVARLHGRRFVGLDISREYLSTLALPRAEGRQTAASIATLPLFSQARP